MNELTDPQELTANGFTGSEKYGSAGVIHPGYFYCSLCTTGFKCDDPLEYEYVKHVAEFHPRELTSEG